jgi:hypothetical protein
MDIGNLITIPHHHHPSMKEEPVVDRIEVDQGLGKAQFLQSTLHFFG